MKKPFAVSLCLGSFLVASLSPAADLKQSKFTQVVNDVRVISTADNSDKAAVVNTIFNMPDLVRTGVASRAELVASDNTITRVGASTIFSFDPANRTIDLQQGSLLFHSPKGKGGGTIRTGSATASVLGTTIIVTTTPNGGFKVIDLEGHVAIKFLNGARQELGSGQMTFILPGGNPAPIITIRLDDLTNNSLLVRGFDQPLPSWPLIRQEVANQIKLIQSGRAYDTGLLVGNEATPTTVQVVDANTITADQSSNEPPSNQTSNTTSTTTTTTTTTPPPPPPPTAVTINSSTLDPQYVFNSPITLGAFTFPAGFLAPSSLPNITIGTPTINLTPYNNLPEFAFLVPNGILTINNSLTFSGFPSTATLDLYASEFSIASGSTVEADVEGFGLEPQTAMTLNNVQILDKATLGDIAIVSPAALSLTNGSMVSAQDIATLFSNSTVTLNNATVQGASADLFGATGVSMASGSSLTATGGNLDIADGGGINISDSTINAIAGPPIGDESTGDVIIGATGDTVNISNGTTISAANEVSITSDTGVSIAGSNLTAGGALGILADTTSSDTISVTGNSTLTAGPEQNVVFDSGGDLTVNGATINADPIYGEVFMSSDSGSITVQNASITAGAVSMSAFGDSGSITVQNTSITAPTLSLTAGLTSGSITVQGSVITAPAVTMTTSSATDSITVNQNTSITTSTLTLNSGDGILLDGTGGLNGGGSGTATLTAPANFNNPNCTLTVSNADFSSFSTVNMAAYTIYLTNVIFSGSGTVNLTSRNGAANFNATTIPGDINFIGTNNKYGGTTINAATLPNLYNIHLNSTT